MLARRRFPPVYLLQSELRRLPIAAGTHIPLAAGTHAWGQRHGGTVQAQAQAQALSHEQQGQLERGHCVDHYDYALRSVGDVAWVGIRAIVTR